MAYFINVGPFKSNGGRPGARGYHIRRSANVVTVTWGGIVVVRRQQVTYAWSGTTQFKRYRCSSAKLANMKRKELERKRVDDEGYKKLLLGHRIVRTAASKESTRKYRTEQC